LSLKIHPLKENMFKSYYVVWKLFQRGHLDQVETRLNRTM